MVMAGSTLLELLTENSTLASHVWFISGVNFTCQLSRAKEIQILCKTVFLSLSVRVFLKEMNIWVGRLSKEDPSSLTWIGILQSVEDQREQKGRRRAKLLSSLELGLASSTLRYDHSFGLKLDLHHCLPWFSGIWLWTRTTPSTFLGLQLADSRLWDSSASIVVWANPSP